MILARALRVVALAFVLMAAGGGVLAAVYFDHLFPFDLGRAPNVFTKYHLSLLARDPERCIAALDRAGVEYRRAPPLKTDGGCGHDDGVRLQSSAVRYGNEILLRCPAMLGVLLWERHVLVPAAQAHFAQKPVSVRHLGTYACRPILHEKGRALSQHAFANAIDLAAFTLEGGDTVSVLSDWNDAGEKGRFLRDLRDGACRIFGTTLSPDFDKAHANHFHLDMGARRICR